MKYSTKVYAIMYVLIFLIDICDIMWRNLEVAMNEDRLVGCGRFVADPYTEKHSDRMGISVGEDVHPYIHTVDIFLRYLYHLLMFSSFYIIIYLMRFGLLWYGLGYIYQVVDVCVAAAEATSDLDSIEVGLICVRNLQVQRGINFLSIDNGNFLYLMTS